MTTLATLATPAAPRLDLSCFDHQIYGKSMAPIRIYAESPINAAKPSGVTPRTAAPAEGIGPLPATTTTTAAGPRQAQPAAQPGSVPSLPAPTGTVSSQGYAPIQPTPTRKDEGAEGGPPPPQPGAVANGDKAAAAAQGRRDVPPSGTDSGISGVECALPSTLPSTNGHPGARCASRARRNSHSYRPTPPAHGNRRLARRQPQPSSWLSPEHQCRQQPASGPCCQCFIGEAPERRGLTRMTKTACGIPPRN